jgi:hypothetical protein
VLNSIILKRLVFYKSRARQRPAPGHGPIASLASNGRARPPLFAGRTRLAIHWPEISAFKIITIKMDYIDIICGALLFE